jgi:DNA-nicking Smr family endonuclease
MSSFKDFAGLKALREQLEREELQRREEERLRLEREEKARREANLFRDAVGDIAPLQAPARIEPPKPNLAPIARHREADEQAALMQSLSDDFDASSLLETDARLSYARPGVGPDVLQKLRKGHWVIQDQLDLHGMRREEARQALSEFLKKAGQRGRRCVRIIHGKGLGSVNKEPVLKGLVHSWLVQKDEVLAFVVATAADGGAGALVVLLSGRIGRNL